MLNGFVFYCVITMLLQLNAGFAANGIRMVCMDFLFILTKALLWGFPEQWGILERTRKTYIPLQKLVCPPYCYC
jgi:hypothetical protein